MPLCNTTTAASQKHPERQHNNCQPCPYIKIFNPVDEPRPEHILEWSLKAFGTICLRHVRPILRVNKQIYQEASALLYSTRTFGFDDEPTTFAQFLSFQYGRIAEPSTLTNGLILLATKRKTVFESSSNIFAMRGMSVQVDRSLWQHWRHERSIDRQW